MYLLEKFIERKRQPWTMNIEEQSTLGFVWERRGKREAVQKVRQGPRQCTVSATRAKNFERPCQGLSEVGELEKTAFGSRKVIYGFSFYQDAKLIQLPFLTRRSTCRNWSGSSQPWLHIVIFWDAFQK